MCNGLNFTKINQKRKELITSIFARFGSVDAGKKRVVAVAGGGIEGNDSLDIGQSENNDRIVSFAPTR
ncbi:hypothetical protein VT98_10595 [Candidatus Electrothrix communis]|uniref:Uncharacterized protein n=1 Tax=Candidatus Electrothrix communis TaxID=1859133 RepID=A0A3S3R3L9_9BACT|nr:hypothetical protein VT98_10595 [Candidatus Electrothrix communis]WLE97061.1 MAG: hypothetical protein QTN59_20590 [Candidatus Electrothrix communis]